MSIVQRMGEVRAQSVAHLFLRFMPLEAREYVLHVPLLIQQRVQVPPPHPTPHPTPTLRVYIHPLRCPQADSTRLLAEPSEYPST